MKIVVVSDSHGNKNILDKIVKANPDASLFIHAGDSTLPPNELMMFKAVKGNCDLGYDYPKELTILTPYGKIYVTHGHQYFHLGEKEVKAKNCKIFIFGHTHRHYLASFDDCYLCNPGSVSLPRDGSSGTYLIINLDEKDCQFEFKYL